MFLALVTQTLDFYTAQLHSWLVEKFSWCGLRADGSVGLRAIAPPPSSYHTSQCQTYPDMEPDQIYQIYPHMDPDQTHQIYPDMDPNPQIFICNNILIISSDHHIRILPYY